jgi:hypothetical protein
LLRRNGDASGDSRPLGPIPWTRRIRERMWILWRAYLLVERHKTAGLGGVHCGELGHALEKAGRGRG